MDGWSGASAPALGPIRQAGPLARPTGIPAIGDASWGTHFCQFYATRDDLADTLVPYFKAGLENGEFCMWVTSLPLETAEAWERLAAAVPDLAGYRRRGRIEILPHDQWYLQGGSFDPDRVLKGWIDRLEDALARGCEGLRLTGNTFWLENTDWQGFVDYEAAVDAVIGRYRMMALCTYALDRCGAAEIADVIRNHEFALLKREGRWQRFESVERRRMTETHALAIARERDALQASEERLREANEKLQEANEKLQEADRRKDRFLGVLSHELRNPLAPIRYGLAVLERAPAGGEQARHALEVIDRQVTQLAGLVGDLLDVTRIAHGRIRVQRERLDLAGLVSSAIEDHRAMFQRAGIRLETDLPAEPVPAEVDASRLSQIVGNLLQNAAKFGRPGGLARVALVVEGGEAVLRVTDDGIGMSPETQARLFEPFMQAEQELDRGRGGLGLGLALCKALVELHGGRIEARSEGLEKGAQVRVVLPLAEGPVAQRGMPPPAPVMTPRRLLIIEDHADAADSLRLALQHDGHEVAIAGDGPAGIALARTFGPDAVLCDIGLPGMDGYEVARAFREDPELRGAFLVALSGYALPEDVRRATEAGFDRHMAKPPALAEIRALLAKEGT